MRPLLLVSCCTSLGLWGASATGTEAVALSLGVTAQLGVQGQSEPSPNRYELPRSGDEVTEPSYAGFGYGGGLTFEARFFKVVALGAEALFMKDGLSGTIEHEGQSVELSLRHSALHAPIYVKGILPLSPLAPFATAGVEFVVPGLSTVQVEPQAGHQAVAAAEVHSLLFFGLGAELELGDLRPHAGVRVGLRPGASSAQASRVTVLPSDAVVYNSTPELQAMFTLGVNYVF